MGEAICSLDLTIFQAFFCGAEILELQCSCLEIWDICQEVRTSNPHLRNEVVKTLGSKQTKVVRRELRHVQHKHEREIANSYSLLSVLCKD